MKSRPVTNERLLNFVGHSVSLLTVLSIGIFTLWLVQRIWIDTTPFDTDEADHANAALELYTWASRGDILESIRSVSRQAFYPPINSIFIAASYALFGPSFASSRLPSVILFGVMVILLFAACLRFARGIGAVKSIALSGASAVAFIAATSPITISNAVLCMLELCGITLLALLIHLTVSANTPFRPSNMHLITYALIGALIFLTKYNFGIVVIPALFATILLAPKAGGSFRERFLQCLPPGMVILIVLGIWLLITDRAAMFHFFVGHKSYAPILSSENLLFELRAWLSSYCVDSFAATWVLLSALIGGLTGWRSFSLRFALFTALSAFGILVLSTTNEERHFIIALPAIIFLAFAGMLYLAKLLATLFRGNQILPLTCIISLFAVAVLSWMRDIDSLNTKIGDYFEGDPEFNELFEFIVSNVDPNSPTIVNGVSDEFGIEALRWMLARHSSKAYTEVILETYHYRDDKNRTARLRKRNVDAPYRIDNFPKQPFSAVLKKGYYRRAIQITRLDGKQRFRKEAEEFRTALEGFSKLEHSAAGRSVVVYTIP